MTNPVRIRFKGVSLAEANRLAGSLEQTLRDQASDSRIVREREDSSTQDFGATLGIVLAGPAVVAVAQGIRIWLERHHGVEIEIETSEGKVIARNLTADKAIDLLNAHKG